METVLLEQAAGVLRPNLQGQKVNSFASAFAAKDPPLLRETETKQFRHVVRAPTVVHTYAVSNWHASECFFSLLAQKAFSPTFVNGSSFLQSVLTSRKEAAKSVLSQYVPRITEALFLFQGTEYVSSHMQHRHFYAKEH